MSSAKIVESLEKKDGEKLASLFGKKSAQNFYYGGGHYVPASRLTQKTAYFKLQVLHIYHRNESQR